MMKKRNLKLLIAIFPTVFSLFGVAAATMAWFITSTKINPNTNWKGSTDAAYYQSGTGRLPGTNGPDDPGDPYIIAKPKHLYNLAWLQYMGTYNTTTQGQVDHYYFQLSDEITNAGLDMTGYILPPIGTEDFPFVSVFDGNDKKIVNLTVSNDEDVLLSSSNKHPETFPIAQYPDGFVEPEVVGFFGVVGELSGESYASSVNSIYDFALEDFTVQSTTQNTLIGLAAGYVNADMSGVKVGSSSIVTNGNAAKTAYTHNLSDYGLVGYTTKTGSSGNYEQQISKYYDSSKSGEDPGWGGSISMKDLIS